MPNNEQLNWRLAEWEKEQGTATDKERSAFWAGCRAASEPDERGEDEIGKVNAEIRKNTHVDESRAAGWWSGRG